MSNNITNQISNSIQQNSQKVVLSKFENNIAVVLLTYNRLAFLKDLVHAIKNQTFKVAKIIVVNNSSTDGTAEWLAGVDGIEVITQANVGSSGGQYTGIKAAYSTGLEWIWTMDDDVLPELDCLEKIVTTLAKTEYKIACPLRYTIENKPYYNDVLKYNFSNPFKNLWESVFSESNMNLEYIEAEGITFEGPIFHRDVISKIGLPEFKFFIYADDSEYMIRAKRAGFMPIIAIKAKLNRRLAAPSNDKEFTWKHYYLIRNLIAIDVLHGKAAIRLIRPFGYLFVWLMRCKSFKDLKTTFLAFLDGYFYSPS